MSKVRNVVIFASGNGSNAEQVIEHSLTADVRYRIRAVFTNNPKAGVIERAKKFNIPHFILDKDYNILELLRGLKIEVVLLAGYLRKVPDKIIDEFYTINIHPSLLPKHGGKGMYGMNVHKAVIESGDKETGMTIHHVTSEYDQGKILYNARIYVAGNDTEITLQKRVQVLEHKFLPIVLDEACRTLEHIISESYSD